MFMQVQTLDAWQEEDGYNINNIFDTGNFLILPDNVNTADIIKVLKKAGILNSRYRKFNIPYFWDDCFQVEYNNIPILELKILTRQEFKEKIQYRYSFNMPLFFEEARIFNMKGKLQ